MKLIVNKTDRLKGAIQIPASKSHTIRAVIIASIAEGKSRIIAPLKSQDTEAAFNACRALGANIEEKKGEWIVTGFTDRINPPSAKVRWRSGSAENRRGRPPSRTSDLGGRIFLDMMNSGTSTNLISGIIAALSDYEIILDGDDSLRSRTVQPLLTALNNLGARAVSLKGNGRPPIAIRGKIKGGKTEVNGISSQFVSALLIACPLAKNDTEIKVVNLHEKPYIEMTLKWLDEEGIMYEKNGSLTEFKIKGSQRYKPFEKRIPADWSSATFPLIAGAVTRADILIEGLDMADTQGDKAVIDYLKKMGADISVEKNGIRVIGGRLNGCDIDLNATPDALPAMAVAGCFAGGTTRLVNVAQARIKETDRIKVMREELTKMGAHIEEMEDGLIIRHSNLKGNEVDGHYDHRVVMALSLAGLIAEGGTEVATAESIDVTFPGYAGLMKNLGADMKMGGN